jgi:hypothetical protein
VPVVTNLRQSEKYQRRTQLCLYLTGGLGGIALFASADNVFLTTTHPVYGAVLLTLGLVAGAVLGMAYAGYQWEFAQMQRRIDDGLSGSAPYDRSLYPPNPRYEQLYRAGSILVALTGAWLVASAWLSVAAGTHSPTNHQWSCSRTTGNPSPPCVESPDSHG